MTGLLTWLGRRFRPLAVAGAGLGLALALWTERAGVAAFPWRLSWPLFLLAIVTFTAGPACGAASFWLLVRDLTRTSRFAPCVKIWMRGFLARYVPLGVLTVAVRVRARAHIEATASQILSATVYEQIAAALGGAFVGSAALACSDARLSLFPAGIVVALASLVAFAPTLARTLGGARWRRRLSLQRLSRRALAAAALATAVGWLFTGVAVWIVVNAISPSTPTLLFMTGAYALAWLTGFVVPLAPSGLGVREATLTGILTPSFGVGPAAVIAVAVRFANILGDLLAATAVEGVALLAIRRAPTPAATAGSSGSH